MKLGLRADSPRTLSQGKQRLRYLIKITLFNLLIRSLQRRPLTSRDSRVVARNGDAPKERIPYLGLALFDCSISVPYLVRIGRRPVLPCGAVHRRRPSDSAVLGHSAAAPGCALLAGALSWLRVLTCLLFSQPLVKPPREDSLPLLVRFIRDLQVATALSKDKWALV